MGKWQGAREGKRERIRKGLERKRLTLVVPLDVRVGGDDGPEETSLDLEGLEVGLRIGRRHGDLFLCRWSVSKY